MFLGLINMSRANSTMELYRRTRYVLARNSIQCQANRQYLIEVLKMIFWLNVLQQMTNSCVSRLIMIRLKFKVSFENTYQHFPNPNTLVKTNKLSMFLAKFSSKAAEQAPMSFGSSCKSFEIFSNFGARMAVGLRPKSKSCMQTKIPLNTTKKTPR